MGVSKVVYGNETIVDLTDSTATEKTILEGYTAYDASGTKVFGIAFPAGATLTVTAPSGAVITISKGEESKTQTAGNDPVIFRGLSTGVWTIYITDGTTRSNTKDVLITADYTADITYFVATIHVKYPEGMICTITNGSITAVAPDTSGVWDYRADYPGTWTASLSNGFSEEVTVAEIGEEVTIDKWYVYKDGDMRSDLTGGWKSFKKQSPTIKFLDDSFHVSTSTTTNQPAGLATTNNAINVTGFKTLYAFGKMTSSLNSTVSILQAGMLASQPTSAVLKSGDAVTSVKGSGEHTIAIDISSLTDELSAMWPFMNIYCCKGYFYQLWLEA